jgi:predicted secreted protein
MSLLNAFFIYFLIWWVMLFTTLPLGVKKHEEHGKGFDAGAPEKPDLGKKLLLNTALSAVILGIIEVLVKMGIINWHAWFENAWK